MKKVKIIRVIIVLLFASLLVYIAYTQSTKESNMYIPADSQMHDNSISETQEQINNSQNENETENKNDETELNDFSVSSVTGMDVDDAAIVLNVKGFVWDAEYEYHEDIPDGQVTSVRMDEDRNLLICTVNINQKELDEAAEKFERENWLRENAVKMPEIVGESLDDALYILNKTGGIEIKEIRTTLCDGEDHYESGEYVVDVLDLENNHIDPETYITRGTEVYLVVCVPETGNNE